jgi:hypothetical protein
MLSVELAVYADSLAGEAAALAARGERLRSRLRVAAIEREARRALTPAAVERLTALGLLARADERALRSELHELEEALAALHELQAWVEERLAGADEPSARLVWPLAGGYEPERGVSATRSPPSES